jgi:hypothetical protein
MAAMKGSLTLAFSLLQILVSVLAVGFGKITKSDLIPAVSLRYLVEVDHVSLLSSRDDYNVSFDRKRHD